MARAQQLPVCLGSVYTCMLDTDETGVKVKIPVKVQKVVILGAVVRYDAKVVSAKRDEVLNLAVGGAVRFASFGARVLVVRGSVRREGGGTGAGLHGARA